MQTPVTAPQASKPKAPAIPALMPLPPATKANTSVFWAVFALNDDACVQALNAVGKTLQGDNSSIGSHTKRVAIKLALENAIAESLDSFENCRKAGGLLYAWHGSRALLQPLPSSLRGAQ